MPRLPDQVLCDDGVDSSPDLGAAIAAIDGITWDYTGLGVAEWVCALIIDHSGSHVTHVQTTLDDEEWWLRWGDGVVKLVSQPICEGEGDEGQDNTEDETYCLLPDRHDGPHTDGEMHWVGEHPARDNPSSA